MQTFPIMILFILCGFCSKAQSLKAITQSGNEESYQVNNNLKITFDSSAFVFSKGGIILKKWGYGEVRKIVYADRSTSTIESIPSLQFDKVIVYPHPINEQISITYHIPELSNVRIHLYSLKGGITIILDMGILEPGSNTSTITIPSSIPSGSYILCIQGNTFSFSIPIIHSKG